MKYYYGHSGKKLVRLAKIYTKEEHGLSKKDIDYEAAWIMRTLKEHGHVAYVVGGAIRDFLAGKIPKDFDIVTNAHPKQIKRYFRRARIVGKRFPIVIIPVGKNDFIEISTFRSDEEQEAVHAHKKKLTQEAALDRVEFGTMEQDVKRRDFTCNALYYDISKEEIIDFVDGVEHIREKKLVPVRIMFEEDPIRMLRALKYASKINLSIPRSLQFKIKRNAKLFLTVSSSRIGDEVMKILISGVSKDIMEYLFAYNLLKYLLPEVDKWYSTRKNMKENLMKNLAQADLTIAEKYSRIRGLQMLMKEYVLDLVKHNGFAMKKGHLTHKSLLDILSAIKSWLHPITPPNVEIQSAILLVLQSEKLVSPHIRWIVSPPGRIQSRPPKFGG